MKQANAVIENYINGNLSDAKAGALRCSALQLIRVLTDDYGKTPQAAIAIVSYLTGSGTFQQACDADRSKP